MPKEYTAEELLGSEEYSAEELLGTEASEKKPGFWDTLTSESPGELAARSLPANFVKGMEGMMGRQAKHAEGMARLRGGGIDLSKLTPKAAEEQLSTPEVLGKMANYMKENPSATAAEFLKGIAVDPELLLPIFGATAGSVKLAALAERLGSLGGRTTAKVAGKAGQVTGAAAEGAAINTGVSGAEQFAHGEFRPGELGAAATLGGAAMSPVGLLRRLPTSAVREMGGMPAPDGAATAPDGAAMPSKSGGDTITPTDPGAVPKPGDVAVPYKPQGIISKGLEAMVEFLDTKLGTISTRLGNISEPLRLRAREHGRRTLTDIHNYRTEATPFMAKMKEIEETPLGEELDLAILTNDRQAITKLLRQSDDPELKAAYGQVRGMLNRLGKQLQQIGRLTELRDEYFPRLVKDREGLLATLGVKARTKLDKLLAKAETVEEESAIINSALRGFRPEDFAPGFSKGRVIQEVTKDLRKFYASPAESLDHYIMSAVQDIEKARFFGKHLEKARRDGREVVDLDKSIGNLVREERLQGKLSPKQEVQLESMLRARFGPGEQSMSAGMRTVRDAMYTGLLANVVSATANLADVAATAFAQGLTPTLRAVGRNLSGRREVNLHEFGLADHIAEEFKSFGLSADVMQKSFKLSGFHAMDAFGKNVGLGAALIKARQLAKTPAGVERLRAKYGEGMGEDFPKLIEDLKTGKRSEPVDALLFSELSDLQPISKWELPEGYHTMKNGRVLYMLHSYQIKQLDLVRNTAYKAFKAGNSTKGAQLLAKYGAYMALGGVPVMYIQDWMMGRKTELDVGTVAELAVKPFGLSRYTTDKVASGKLLETVAGMATPPYKMGDEILRLDPKALRYIPIVGKVGYAHAHSEEQERKQRAKKAAENKPDWAR